jgi:5-dehydro-2-deoxygluconokinase
MKNSLLILPFDHRGSFKRELAGSEKISKKQRQELEQLKFLIYRAFLKIYKKYENKDELAILVDEEFGSKILRDAKRAGIQICLTTEKSGQKEFKFEYGNSFGRHINSFNPDFVKALVRYNPLNKKVNARQLKRLSRLSEFCQNNNYPLLLELLVPPTEKDLQLAKTKANYEKTVKVTRTIRAVLEIKAKVKVNIWKMEGFSKQAWKSILKKIPKDSKVIVLGRGEDEKKVKKWLADAAEFDKIIGFAVGRTIFLNALKKYTQNQISKNRAIDKIAENFVKFIKYWKKNK